MSISRNIRRAVSLVIGFVLIMLFGIVLLALLGGCSSATKTVAKAAQRIDAKAEGIQTKGTAITTELDKAIGTGEVGPLAMPHIEQSRILALDLSKDADAIRDEVGLIQDRIPDIQDKTSTWARVLLVWGPVVGLVIGAGLLIYLGVGSLSRPIMAWLGMIPGSVKGWAKLTSEGKHEEATAALRASDPVVDAAFRKEHEKVKAAPAPGSEPLPASNPEPTPQLQPAGGVA